jgi:hypothetical protein
MNPMPTRYVVLALIAGALWGAIGLAFTGQMLGASAWAGVLVAPFVGLAVAVVFRGFRDRPPGARIALSLVSLYFAAGLFALAAGIVDAAHPISHRNSGGVVIQAVMGVWWGITFAGYLPLLWPLAYFTHSLLGRSDTPLPRAVGVPGASATEAREPLLTHARLEDTPPRDHVERMTKVSLRRGVAKAALALVGVLLMLSTLRGGRGPLGELVMLLVVLGVGFFAGRATWRWWSRQPAAIASIGVLGAFGVTGAGWLFVAIVHRLSRVSSENYGMIIVWPLVFLIGAAVLCATAVAVAVGVAATVTALRKRPPNATLIAIGAIAAVILNLLHLVALARVAYRG